MPLPRAEREIELLTQGWPGDPDDFELAGFAATFRSDRPELSAPAMDRIGRQMQAELARLDRSAARRQSVRATTVRFRRFAPLAAAAAVAIAVGAWVHFRGGSVDVDPVGARRSVPVIHAQPTPTPSKTIIN